ncbi:MAG: methyl-accepting chemotaxis protein, partial [Gammaproteobacteria bacterium]|nr:methyl-accepting chemotaxis protein [Gammaproteobacteria bacterium]
MLRWFSALSLRWKLQIAFMAVTMITTVYNRLLATWQMDHLLKITRDHNISAEALAQLQNAYDSFIFASFWESGIQFVVQFVIIGVFASLFVRPILSLRDSLKAIQKGDLTHTVKVSAADEIGELQTSFNAMQATLNRIIGNVDYCAVHMGQSAYQIAAISHEIENITRNQDARSDDVMQSASTISAFSDNVRVIADETTRKAQATEAQAHEGLRL